MSMVWAAGQSTAEHTIGMQSKQSNKLISYALSSLSFIDLPGRLLVTPARSPVPPHQTAYTRPLVRPPARPSDRPSAPPAFPSAQTLEAGAFGDARSRLSVHGPRAGGFVYIDGRVGRGQD